MTDCGECPSLHENVGCSNLHQLPQWPCEKMGGEDRSTARSQASMSSLRTKQQTSHTASLKVEEKGDP